ncbi:hypothetical protein FDP08_04675 [Marinobacter panjinensis]|uniref:Uncharacterized protein n=1 Tax=Marinobacter panjinensis TaxID=2576384 RepID=A0A4U6R1W6_9GAMM|nr:hypothetical protein [Marinobacter panjinensis]MCR8913937.1 hypothetical protein [Marinobacter panjinensis]TKV67429.1 hypothetical protein FDP08_04675 [Marinobacter panjinensis]
MSRVKYEPLLIGLALLLFLTGCRHTTEPPALAIELTPAELTWIGDQVFRNECTGRKTCLVHWNEGEAFPSLGIGHFIWYPSHVDGQFVESFPALIHFMREQSVPLPEWLGQLEPFDAPWPDRKAFMQAEDHEESDERVTSLREFLWATRGVQAEFIVRRARSALERVVSAAPEPRRAPLRDHLQQLIETPGGAYAVVDYVNFKGEGLSAQETYQGQGWGLLQVLLAMPENDESALERFRTAAKNTLTGRAELAPRAIERERWLPGWLARIDTYREPR